MAEQSEAEAGTELQLSDLRHLQQQQRADGCGDLLQISTDFIGCDGCGNVEVLAASSRSGEERPDKDTSPAAEVIARSFSVKDGRLAETAPLPVLADESYTSQSSATLSQQEDSIHQSWTASESLATLSLAERPAEEARAGDDLRSKSHGEISNSNSSQTELIGLISQQLKEEKTGRDADAKRLEEEKTGRDADVKRLEVELAALKAKSAAEIEGLEEEARAAKRALEALKSKSAAEFEGLEEEVRAAKRELGKAENGRKRADEALRVHQTDTAKTVSELREKFGGVVKEAMRRGNDALEEERRAHDATREELQRTSRELEALRAERAPPRKEGKADWTPKRRSPFRRRLAAWPARHLPLSPRRIGASEVSAPP